MEAARDPARPHGAAPTQRDRERDPPRISVALNAFGGASVVISVLFLGGSFYIENDLGKAFCLGAFFSGMLGSILLLGFAKIIDLLDAIRMQTVTHGGPHAGPSADPSAELGGRLDETDRGREELQ